MKNILFLFFIFFQVVAYGQFDSLRISKLAMPDYSQTRFPKGDGLTYNQYIGETISGYVIANGWRRDTINGGFNKEIYNNPYISSRLDYLGFDKNNQCAQLFKCFLYKNGIKFTGKILDTLTLSYSRPFRVGTYYSIETSYERKDIKAIFQADCINGLIQGFGTLSDLNSKEVISHCNFEEGEIVGEVTIIGLLSKNIHRVTYDKGSCIAVGTTETDSYGDKIEPERKLSFKETYLSLLFPYEILKKSKKAQQAYVDNMKTPGGLHRNPLLLEPLDMILNYFNTIRLQIPVKKYKTDFFEISEYKYDDIKIVFNSFHKRIQDRGALIIECYDKFDRLLIIRYENVSYEAINGLDFPEYLQFFHYIGSGYNLTTFMYDEKGNIKKASKYSGVFDNDISTMCEYEDFTDKIRSSLYFKPISITNQRTYSTKNKGNN